MRKLLFMLMLVLAVAVFACTALAAEAEVDGVYYTLNESAGTASVSATNRTVEKTVFEIPSTITVENVTYNVTSIEKRAFADNKTVVEIRILSEYITEIPDSMFTNTAATLNKVFIDFSNFTRIGDYGLNVSVERNDRTPTPCLDTFRFYDAKAYIADKSEVVITNPDFSSLTYLGDAAFQNCAKFENITIPSAVMIKQQTFRNTTAKHVKVLGEIQSIPTHFLAGASSLLTVEFTSRSITTIGASAVTGAKNLQWIKIDLSSCTYYDGSCFIFSTGYDQGNTTAIWYDLDGNRRVDLSAAKTIRGQTFASSNLGGSGATEIIWPEAINVLDSQVFRKCNITGTIYINASEGKTLKMEFWAFEGNSPSLVICGPGVTKIEATFTRQCTVVCLADNVALTDANGTFRASGSTLYAKSTATVANPKNVTINQITGGAVSYSLTCGVTADVITQNGTVTLGSATHNFVAGEYDNTYCPIDTFKTHTCSKCNASKLVSDIEGLAPKAHDHSITADIVYVDYTKNGTYTYKCSECASTITESEPSASALITFYGYSIKEGDGGSICIGYEANLNAIDAYRAFNPDFKYGVIAYVPTAQDTSLKLINDDYTLVNPEYTIFTEIESIASFEFVIRGFGIEHADLALVMCAYVYDGKTASYLSLNQESLELKQESEAKTVTLNGFAS